MTVGKSGRTPFKHEVIDRTIGREVGILQTGSVAWARSLLVVDATAGDGAGLATDDVSTPGIVARHARHLTRLPVQWHLIERDPEIYRDLAANLAAIPSQPNVAVMSHHGDAISVVPSLPRVSGQALTYLDDPNSGLDSTLTPAVLDWIFSRGGATVYASIATNPAGVNRLGPSNYATCRARYLGLLERAGRTKSREPVMVRLNGDPCRWGYLIVTSTRFADAAARELGRISRTGVAVDGGRRAEVRLYRGFAEVERIVTAMTTPGSFEDPIYQPTLI